MDIQIIGIILLLHFIGDFVLQPRSIGETKHYSNFAMFKHIIIYTLILALLNPMWAIINGVIHLFVDIVTSRLGHYFYNHNRKQLYIVVHGVDQLLHYTALFITYDIMHKLNYI